MISFSVLSMILLSYAKQLHVEQGHLVHLNHQVVYVQSLLLVRHDFPLDFSTLYGLRMAVEVQLQNHSIVGIGIQIESVLGIEIDVVFEGVAERDLFSGLDVSSANEHPELLHQGKVEEILELGVVGKGVCKEHQKRID